MIGRSATRQIDERGEERFTEGFGTAAFEFRGRRHVVRVGNLSLSGAMITFAQVPNIGEQVALHLLDRGKVSAKVRWAKDGRIGLSLDPQSE